MSSRRVVVTGIGVVSALGNDVNRFSENLFSGKSAIAPIESIDVSSIRFKKAAEVRDFEAAELFEKQELAIIKPFSQFAVTAAREAIASSGIEWKDEASRQRTAIITATGAGGLTDLDQQYEDLYRHNKKRTPPMIVPQSMANSAASFISMETGVCGPTYTVSTACSSSNHAIGLAFHSIRSGMVDAAITGGSETPISFSNLKAWEALRVVSGDTCRPFSKDRSGMVLGEGGAMLVLEEMEAAARRGAPILAEIAGFGMTADAHHITQPSVEGPVRAMKNALEDASLETASIGYVNAHGTATNANDSMESEAINQVFGEHAPNVAVSSTKSMHGHTLGAAGAIEAVATVLALKTGVLPPNANYSEADPDCNVDVIANEAREVQVEAAVSNSFAFGGLNAVLVFKSLN
ncbi:MAG: beta-ketoacyl-[acyl-carrier-protein] synthase family protein [Acidobacteria bacterium]|nr:MAG: beta-ketoacyl-[acyl-carrier-protein] synthase family protein [Acidobacteriota bacterium]REJ99325.1 MAG: beta-ketoacyl-[acyl-carrier-protein] synthase family protein [Acidobacteriota bacterium]REK15653.1 MAG: beta-ketoacyl-[acyl-carrier-protein] synthase family protein [Acidobacteriota bacterium]REK43636.1 MAG: beta-ketoacyl-[acyl-carrier-protein] synthase family protein [Acidobacteriota bacterium]